MNKLLIIAAALIIGGSLVISSSIIAKSKTNYSVQMVDDSILTETSVAKMLHITTKELDEIILQDKEAKKNLGTWEPLHYLPYIEIGNNKLFLKQDIEKWIAYRSTITK
jgi:hypothetical protein